MLQRFLLCDFIIVLKKNVSISMPFSEEVGVSVAAYSELLDESKSTVFSKFAGIVLLCFNYTEINFSI